jgi:uncharacterized protein DUF4350
VTVAVAGDDRAAPSRPASRQQGWVRRWGPWLVIAGLFLTLGIAAEPSGQGGYLDPAGTGAQGAKALVLLLRQYGARVTTDAGVPGPGVGTALVLTDTLDPVRRQQLARWVSAGGRLVVADPGSALQPGVPTQVGNGFTTTDLTPSGSCPVVGIDQVETLSVGTSLLLRSPLGTPVVTCFGGTLSDGEPVAFVVSERMGAGQVIGLGGAGVWTNARLDKADNAAFAVGLLAPATGSGIDILTASPAGNGNRSFLSLLNPRLTTAVLQLLVAFAVFAWWRGRRLGRPVAEDQPVRLAGSELVVAVSDLLARTHNRDAAARQLRAGTGAGLGTVLGLGPHAGVDQVADAAAARSAVPRQRVVDLLSDTTLADDAALVRLTQALAQLRQEVTHG